MRLVDRAESILRFCRDCGQLALARHRRRVNEKKFLSMLNCLARLDRVGLRELFLPYSVMRHGEALLYVERNVFLYRGPLLIQRRATVFFHHCTNLQRFDWNTIITVQHRLWRRGLGLSEATETLGPKNWALLEGRLYLADSGSLTDKRRRVRACLQKANLDKKERINLSQLSEKDAVEKAKIYFLHIRAAINRENLDQLWKAG